MLCEQLQQLRLQSGLVDLDIVCEVITTRSGDLSHPRNKKMKGNKQCRIYPQSSDGYQALGPVKSSLIFSDICPSQKLYCQDHHINVHKPGPPYKCSKTRTTILMCLNQDHHINVHKVVMAACSKFFKDQLCKVNVQVNKI